MGAGELYVKPVLRASAFHLTLPVLNSSYSWLLRQLPNRAPGRWRKKATPSPLFIFMKLPDLEMSISHYLPKVAEIVKEGDVIPVFSHWSPCLFLRHEDSQRVCRYTSWPLLPPNNAKLCVFTHSCILRGKNVKLSLFCFYKIY